MPVRVVLIDEAVDDLVRYAETGNLPVFLKKLLRLEEVGKDAGLPLRAGLSGYRKIVVGDRDWRIIFTTDPQETIATVVVIGNRSDAACYEEADRRLRSYGEGLPEGASLAAVLFRLSETRRSARKSKRSR